ncbi:MAG: hypothetical protein ACTHKF_05770 [Candidatus Nitrosocosmicus sp.]
MNTTNNERKSDKAFFVNGTQRRFYLITRAFKIGNIAGAAVLVVFIGKTLFGI